MEVLFSHMMDDIEADQQRQNRGHGQNPKR
jgi:hypothetical protein